VRSFRGAESWWGSLLAWMAHSLSIYVNNYKHNVNKIGFWRDIISLIKVIKGVERRT
jgi:hypothetical protein